MDVVIYKKDQMERIGKLLNDIAVSGVQQARILTEIGNIVDSGQIGTIDEKDGDESAMERKEIRED